MIGMRVSFVSTPPEPKSELANRIATDVAAALYRVQTLDGRFLVNDRPFFTRKAAGTLKPCVVNTASYISGHFQKALEGLGWTKEKTVNRQRIDAYIEIPVSGYAFSIPANSFPNVFEEYLDLKYDDLSDVRLDREASRLYRGYVARTKFQITDFPASLRHLFTTRPITSPIRIGLEFETGNIASSFRALMKLEELFSSGHIDLGVFVTCIDKGTCAARIWPQSNRNGSFQELKQREYASGRTVPTFDIGFAPDGFGDYYPFLGKNLKTYKMHPTDRTLTHGGTSYRIWQSPDGEKYTYNDI